MSFLAPEILFETVFAVAFKFCLLAILAFGISRWKLWRKDHLKETLHTSPRPTTLSSPAVTDERAYLEWFIANKKTLVPDGLAEACVKSGLKMLRAHEEAEALFSHVTAMAHDYQSRLKPFIDSHGGIAKCSPAIQSAALNVLINIEIGIEFLEKKHHYKKSADLLKALGLN